MQLLVFLRRLVTVRMHKGVAVACLLLSGAALSAGIPLALRSFPESGSPPATPIQNQATSNIAAHSQKPVTPSQALEFDRDIAPIFKTSCGKCHGGENTQAKLRLDSEAGVMRGGVSGKAVIPGNSSDSLLVKRLLGLTDAPRMPFGMEPLPSSQIELIREWIDHGTFAEPPEVHGQDARATPEGLEPQAAHATRPTQGSALQDT